MKPIENKIGFAWFDWQNVFKKKKTCVSWVFSTRNDWRLRKLIRIFFIDLRLGKWYKQINVIITDSQFRETTVTNVPFRIEYLCIIIVIITARKETVHWHSLTYSYDTNEITIDIFLNLFQTRLQVKILKRYGLPRFSRLKSVVHYSLSTVQNSTSIIVVSVFNDWFVDSLNAFRNDFHLENSNRLISITYNENIRSHGIKLPPSTTHY